MHMNLFKIVRSAAALFLGLLILGWSPVRVLAEEKGGVKFEVFTDKSEYLPGCPVMLRYAIANSTGKEVKIFASGEWLSPDGKSLASPGFEAFIEGAKCRIRGVEGFAPLFETKAGQASVSAVSAVSRDEPILVLKPNEAKAWQKLLPYQFASPGDYELEMAFPKLWAKTSQGEASVLTPSKLMIRLVSESKISGQWKIHAEYLPSKASENGLPSLKWTVVPAKGYKGSGLFGEEGNCRVLIKDSQGKQVADWIYTRRNGVALGSIREEASWEVPLSQAYFEGDGDGVLPGPGNYTVEAFYRCYEPVGDPIPLLAEIAPNFLRAEDYGFGKPGKSLDDPLEPQAITGERAFRSQKGQWVSARQTLEIDLSREDYKQLVK